LSFRVSQLKAGEAYAFSSGDSELAVVPLEGSYSVSAADRRFEISRKNVFDEMPHILYVPPGQNVRIEAVSDCELATGGAPAEGKHPLRLFAPDEMKSELRGGGAALRQVNHVLAHPLPAERLILFEVYVPGGIWSGWPPHCHDGFQESAYLEETYYFRIDPDYSFAFHRNYRIDEDFDETFAVGDRDLVLVTKGFHATAAAPNSKLYFLNYLAGDLLDDERARPPHDDPKFAWIRQDWEANPMPLPVLPAND
jgi:5-deoxy-glucuronate isomerase